MTQREKTCLLATVTAAAIAAGVWTPARAADPATRPVTINIPAESLSAALLQFARQTKLQIFFASSATDGKRANAVSGTFPLGTALDMLVRETGLSFRISGKSVTIGKFDSSAATAGRHSATDAADPGDASESVPRTNTAAPEPPQGQKEQSIQEIVVTGTHIRGETTPISPVISFDQAQIERSGFSTTDDFIRSLPQNFAGGEAGASPDGILGGAEDAARNNEAGSAVDLRGLGANDTLVLLNGRRMAPSDFGSFVDISLIPLAAVDHVDIVTDGASAIYGADAVGGVVNFVLRQDYQGAETTVRYGSVTAGGQQEELANQLVGTHWGSGGALVDLQYRHEGALPTSERPFTEDVPRPTDILPETDRYSGLLSAHQSLLPELKAFTDALVVDSLVSRDETLSTVHSISSNVRNTGINSTTGLDYFPFGDWRIELAGTYSRQGVNVTDPRYTNPPPGYTPGAEDFTNTDRIESGDLEMDGSLLALPGGELKAAYGGSWRDEEFQSSILYLPVGTPGELTVVERHVGAEYLELNIPIVGADNSHTLLRRAVVSLAVRHDHYSDFGGTTNAKYGVLWSPDRALTFRASYDTSFRPPDASELLDQAQGVYAYNLDLTAPSGQGAVPALEVLGVNPNLGPETSRNWTAGLVYKPVSAAQIALDYYDIDFTNRIITPTFDVDAPQKLGVYGSLISPISSQAAAAYVANLIAHGGQFFDVTGDGTNGVQYLYDLETLNAAVVRQTGWDLLASYRFGTAPNRFRVGFNAAVIDKIDTQYTPSSVPTNVVNTYGNPLRLRIRGEVGWFHRDVSVNLAENFSNAYTDTTSIPYGTIGSWATTDATVQYAPPQIRGLSVQLSAINLFNRYPPYVAEGLLSPAVHYDVGNADPQGRFLAMTVRKDW